MIYPVCEYACIHLTSPSLFSVSVSLFYVFSTCNIYWLWKIIYYLTENKIIGSFALQRQFYLLNGWLLRKTLIHNNGIFQLKQIIYSWVQWHLNRRQRGYWIAFYSSVTNIGLLYHWSTEVAENRCWSGKPEILKLKGKEYPSCLDGNIQYCILPLYCA